MPTSDVSEISSPVIMYEAYCDETGDDGGFPLMAVGGYLIKASAAKTLERRWRRVLKRHDLPYFHMVECAHSRGVFKKLSKETAINVQKELFLLINNYVEVAFCCAIPINRFERNSKDPLESYVACLTFGMPLLLSILLPKHPGGDKDYSLSLHYESGHKHAQKALEFFNNADIGGRRPTFSFVKKADSGMIQAADILVWQYAKFIKDQVNGRRKARKDFVVLMEKPAKFWNILPSKRTIYQYEIGNNDINVKDDAPEEIRNQIENRRKDLREFFSSPDKEMDVRFALFKPIEGNF